MFVGSQDGASSMEQLTKNKVTHILNVATGIANFFPDVSGLASGGVCIVPQLTNVMLAKGLCLLQCGGAGCARDDHYRLF